MAVFCVQNCSGMVASPNVGAESVTPGNLSFTVMVTVSLALAPPAVTVSSNVNSVVADTCGAVNVGVAVPAPVRVTAGLPAVCVQA